VRFKLVKTGKRYIGPEEFSLACDNKVSTPSIIWETADVNRIDSLPAPMEVEQTASEFLNTDSKSPYIPEQIYSQVLKWAAEDPKRWQRLHNAILKIYAPAYDYIDARDILVSWAAAHSALTSAQNELKRLESIRSRLSQRETDTKRARQADTSFWGRLSQRLNGKIPNALKHDKEAVELLMKIISEKTVKNSSEKQTRLTNNGHKWP